MLTVPIPLLVIAATALAPLGVGQQARLAAWLSWAVAYRECYKPAPLSLRIDKKLTAHCIENILRGKRSVPPEERAAIDALIAATPYLIGLLDTPRRRNEPRRSRRKRPGGSPSSPLSRLRHDGATRDDGAARRARAHLPSAAAPATGWYRAA